MKKVTSYKGYDVYFEAEKELIPMREHFIGECGWSEEEYKALSASRPKWFCAHVVVKKGDIELADRYLGCCCYNSYKEFYTTYFGDYFKDMMNDAVAEAEAQLSKAQLSTI